MGSHPAETGISAPSLAAATAAIIPLTLTLACASMSPRVQCPVGHTLADGQCVPTPALVFTRCVDSFRKTAVEHDSGKVTKVAVRAKTYGDAEVEHGNQESERAEFAGVSDSLLAEALVECRRQEEQERAGLLARAWAEAEAQRVIAAKARRTADEATQARDVSAKESARLAEALTASENSIAALQEALASAQAEREAEWARISEEHPCLAEDWARCGEQALTAKHAGDFAHAHRLLQQSCVGGDAKSCANWGVMFEQGLGVVADPVVAYARYEQACELGSVPACASQGIMLRQGRGTAQDDDKAAKLLPAECRAEVPRACARLGRMVEQGAAKLTSKRSSVSALYAYGCEHDDARACLWLGDWNRQGTSSRPASASKAAAAYQRACDGEVAEGCLRLAELHEAGEGVDKDSARAHALSEQACRAGLSMACASAERLAHVTDAAGVEVR